MCQEVNQHLLQNTFVTCPIPVEPLQPQLPIRIKEEVDDEACEQYNAVESYPIDLYNFGTLIEEPDMNPIVRVERLDPSAIRRLMGKKDRQNHTGCYCPVCHCKLCDPIQLKNHLRKHFSTKVRLA